MSADNENIRYQFMILPEEGENFWDINKELIYLEPYLKLIKEEGKNRSSDIMKAIYLCYDPKSPFQNTGGRTLEEIQNDIVNNFLEDPSFDWSQYSQLIEIYKKDSRTKLERELDYWEMQLRERREFIKELPWDDKPELKDNMLNKSKKLFEDYISVIEKVENERKTTKGHGNTRKSLLEE